MTLAHLQVAVMIAMTGLQLVWYLGIWRARSEHVQDALPELERRMAALERTHADLAGLVRAIEELRARLEQIAQRSHEAVNRLNALPDTMRPQFLAKDVADVIIREATEDRQRLHRRLDDLQALIRERRGEGHGRS